MKTEDFLLWKYYYFPAKCRRARVSVTSFFFLFRVLKPPGGGTSDLFTPSADDVDKGHVSGASVILPLSQENGTTSNGIDISNYKSGNDEWRPGLTFPSSHHLDPSPPTLSLGGTGGEKNAWGVKIEPPPPAKEPHKPGPQDPKRLQGKYNLREAQNQNQPGKL